MSELDLSIFTIMTDKGPLDILKTEWYDERSELGVSLNYQELSEFIDVSEYLNRSTVLDLLDLTGGFKHDLSWAIVDDTITPENRYQKYKDKWMDIYNKSAKLYVRESSRYRGSLTSFYKPGSTQRTFMVRDWDDPLGGKVECEPIGAYYIYVMYDSLGNETNHYRTGNGLGMDFARYTEWREITTGRLVNISLQATAFSPSDFELTPPLLSAYISPGVVPVTPYAQNIYPPLTADLRSDVPLGEKSATITSVGLNIRKSSGIYSIVGNTRWGSPGTPGNLGWYLYDDDIENVEYRRRIVFNTNFDINIYLIDSAIIDIEGDDIMYNPRIGTKGIGFYKMNKPEMQFLFKCLWETDWRETLAKMLGKTMDGIMSVKWYYGVKDQILTDGTKYTVVIGNANAMAEGGVTASAEKCTNEFVKLEFLPITVARIHNNFMDFTHTDIDIFLPFYGYAKLDPSTVMGNTLYISYHFSLMTGAGVITIEMEDSFGKSILDNYPVNMAVDIPVDAEGQESFMGRIVNATLKSAPHIAAAVVTGGASVPVSAAAAGSQVLSAAGSVAGDALSDSVNGGLTPSNVTRAGGLGPESSVLAPMKLALNMTYPEVLSDDMSKYIGKPQYKIKKLSTYTSGDFVQVLAVGPQSINSDIKYSNELIQLLRSGVFI